MEFLYRLSITVVVVLICFALYSPFSFFYVIGAIVYLGVSSYAPDSKGNLEERDDQLFPSTHVGTDVSSAWLGAKMEEDEARRNQAGKESRDQ